MINQEHIQIPGKTAIFMSPINNHATESHLQDIFNKPRYFNSTSFRRHIRNNIFF